MATKGSIRTIVVVVGLAAILVSLLAGFLAGTLKIIPLTFEINGKPTLLMIYLYVIVGIIISVVLPILRKAIPVPPKESRYVSYKFAERLWDIARPYLMLGIFSALAAIIIVASLGETLVDWKAAVLAGFAWDSLLQKAGHGAD